MAWLAVRSVAMLPPQNCVLYVVHSSWIFQGKKRGFGFQLSFKDPTMSSSVNPSRAILVYTVFTDSLFPCSDLPLPVCPRNQKCVWSLHTHSLPRSSTPARPRSQSLSVCVSVQSLHRHTDTHAHAIFLPSDLPLPLCVPAINVFVLCQCW